MSVKKNSKYKNNKASQNKKVVTCYGCGGPHYKNKYPQKNQSEKSNIVLYTSMSDSVHIGDNERSASASSDDDSVCEDFSFFHSVF